MTTTIRDNTSRRTIIVAGLLVLAGLGCMTPDKHNTVGLELEGAWHATVISEPPPPGIMGGARESRYGFTFVRSGDELIGSLDFLDGPLKGTRAPQGERYITVAKDQGGQLRLTLVAKNTGFLDLVGKMVEPCESPCEISGTGVLHGGRGDDRAVTWTAIKQMNR